MSMARMYSKSNRKKSIDETTKNLSLDEMVLLLHSLPARTQKTVIRFLRKRLASSGASPDVGMTGDQIVRLGASGEEKTKVKPASKPNKALPVRKPPNIAPTIIGPGGPPADSPAGSK